MELHFAIGFLPGCIDNLMIIEFISLKVLAGTTLMAVFAFYVLPYGWSFNFCMVFGAIASATDPVAVAALLQELGAPPRLKTHISGESLLNDGAAVVFFKIFESLYLLENGLGGEDIGLGKGIWQFIQMSIGAAILGVLFGAALSFMLYMLNRRFNGEEKIVQVTATFCMAYLSFYVAEAVLHWSGVICVVFCGLTTKAVANSLIIDQEMMNKFWSLTEHILNTILFAIAGLVWGVIISPNTTRVYPFGGEDWGYLILTYIVLFIVRFFLFGLFFPIISRIGLKSKWKEMVFHAFGGLRGAVGIALAVLIDSEVANETVRIDGRRGAPSQLFGITGGITLMTLFINGTACGPLLKKLKLNRSTKQRQEILKRFDKLLKKHVLDTFMRLLGEPYYNDVDFDLISHHLPQVSTNLSYKEARSALRRVKYTTPPHLYQPPNLSVFESMFTEEEHKALVGLTKLKLFERIREGSEYIRVLIGPMPDELNEGKSECDEEELKEMRLVFVELLRKAYATAMDNGNIDVRDVIVVNVLTKSVAVVEDEVSNGNPINDWNVCQKNNKIFERFERSLNKVHLATAFIAAHTEAQNVFKYKVHQDGFLTPVERVVLEESAQQVALASDALNEYDPAKLRKILSLKLCGVLLHGAAIEISKLIKTGLLKEEEGEHYLEHLEGDLMVIRREQNKKTKQMINNSTSFLKVGTTDLDDLRREH